MNFYRNSQLIISNYSFHIKYNIYYAIWTFLIVLFLLHVWIFSYTAHILNCNFKYTSTHMYILMKKWIHMYRYFSNNIFYVIIYNNITAFIVLIKVIKFNKPIYT